MQQQLHGRAQQMLRNRVVTAAASQRSQQHREALIARLDMDASLLLSAFIHSFVHIHSFAQNDKYNKTIYNAV